MPLPPQRILQTGWLCLKDLLPLDVDPVPINTKNEPTDAFINTVNNIIDSITYFTDYISYKPETVLLQLAEIRKKIKVAASTYQDSMPYPSKYLLRAVTDPTKFLIRHLQNHPYFPPTALNRLETDERDNTAVATHRNSTNELFLSTASSTVPSIFRPILQIQLLQVIKKILTRISAHYLHKVIFPADFTQDYHYTSHLRHHQEHILWSLHITHHSTCHHESLTHTHLLNHDTPPLIANQSSLTQTNILNPATLLVDIPLH